MVGLSCIMLEVYVVVGIWWRDKYKMLEERQVW